MLWAGSFKRLDKKNMKFNELSNRMFNVNHLFWFHANGILLYFIEWRFMSEKMMPKMRSKWRWPTEVTERAAFKSQSTKLVTSLFRTSVWFQSIFELSLFVSWIDCKFAEIHSQSRYCLKCCVWSDAKKSFDIDFSRGFNRLFHLFEQPKSTYPPNKVIAPNFILGSTIFERGIGNILSTLPRKLMKPKAKYCALRQELAFSMNADILWHLRFFTLIGTDKRIERLSKRYFLKSVRMQTQAIKSKVPLLIRRSEKVCLNLIYWPSV